MKTSEPKPVDPEAPGVLKRWHGDIMKKGKDYLILVGGLLLVGAGIALQRQYSEIKDLRAKLAAVAHGQSVRADEKSGLEKRLRAAEMQVETLRAELDRATRAAISSKPASAVRP